MMELRDEGHGLEKSSSAPMFPVGVPTPPPTLGPPLEHSLSMPVQASMRTETPPTKSYLSKPTGRIQAQEAKPDLWKIALYSIQFIQQKVCMLRVIHTTCHVICCLFASRERPSSHN